METTKIPNVSQTKIPQREAIVENGCFGSDEVNASLNMRA
jgi:hypothetical protein